MDVITHVKTFVMVARHGSFTEAAKHLEVVPSVVARRIAQLEEELSARLFERNTRKVQLSEAGEKFYARAFGLVADFEELMLSTHRDAGALEGHLNILVPTTLMVRRLAPIFADFLAEHPSITMRMSLVDRSTNPVEAGFDLVISGRAASFDGVVDLPLCPVQPVLCATREYIDAFGEPTHPRDLASHRCLVFTPTGTTWNFESARGVISVDVMPRLQSDDNISLLEAARRSLGIASLPKYVIVDELASGELVPLMPNYTPQENWFKAYIPRRNMKLARIKALVEWLGERWTPV